MELLRALRSAAFNRGIANPQNACFANACIQSLLPIAEFCLALLYASELELGDAASLFTVLVQALWGMLDEKHLQSLKSRFDSSKRSEDDAIQAVTSSDHKSSESQVAAPAEKKLSRHQRQKRNAALRQQSQLNDFQSNMRSEFLTASNIFRAPLDSRTLSPLIDRFQSQSGHRLGQQEDVHEFLHWLLDQLHVNLVPPAAVSDSSKMHGYREMSSVETEWCELFRQSELRTSSAVDFCRSPMSRLFGGRLQSVVASGSRTASVTIQPFWSLSIDIWQPTISSVEVRVWIDPFSVLFFCGLCFQQAIHHFFTDQDEINDYKRRSAVTTATHQHRLDRLPHSLILHLKRFNVIAQHGESGTFVEKLDKHIDFSPTLNIQSNWCSSRCRETIEIEQKSSVEPCQPLPNGCTARFALRAVVVHLGETLSSGHYIAYVRQSKPECPLASHSLISERQPIVTPTTESKQPTKQPSASSKSSSKISQSKARNTVTKKPIVTKTLPSYDELSSSSSDDESPVAPQPSNSKSSINPPKPYAFDRDVWLKFDDHRVASTQWSYVSQQDPYMLFYELLL